MNQTRLLDGAFLDTTKHLQADKSRSARKDEHRKALACSAVPRGRRSPPRRRSPKPSPKRSPVSERKAARIRKLCARRDLRGFWYATSCFTINPMIFQLQLDFIPLEVLWTSPYAFQKDSFIFSILLSFLFVLIVLNVPSKVHPFSYLFFIFLSFRHVSLSVPHGALSPGSPRRPAWRCWQGRTSRIQLLHVSYTWHSKGIDEAWLSCSKLFTWLSHVSFFRLHFSMVVICIMSEYVIVWHILTYIDILCFICILHVLNLFMSCVRLPPLFPNLGQAEVVAGKPRPSTESRDLAENLANVRSIPCGVSPCACQIEGRMGKNNTILKFGMWPGKRSEARDSEALCGIVTQIKSWSLDQGHS